MLPDVKVSSIELLDEEVVGLEKLRLVANKLYGDAICADSLGPHEVGETVKHSIHRGMTREISEMRSKFFYTSLV